MGRATPTGQEEPSDWPGTWYFLGLGILYAVLYLLLRAFLPSGVHMAEEEGEFMRQAGVLMVLGWGALKRGRGWAWAGVAYLALDILYAAWGMFAGGDSGLGGQVLFIKGFFIWLGIQAARKKGF